ncbi:MAG: indole-3-glycerol phosphate synthase TrpC [Anaerolineae bacterium]|nr:indole-3-glycerol phosphate synthase TrpC [Anaerolineae bacterium]
MSILDEIFAHKRAEVARQKQARPLVEVRAAAEQAAPPLDFVAALQNGHARPALIAEVKRASPSRGLLARDFDPVRLARLYQANGAAAISVLTDARYFMGDIEHLRQISMTLSATTETETGGLSPLSSLSKEGQDAVQTGSHRAPRLPLLRKDFLFDRYQLYEARAAGADAALLIVAGLEPARLRDLHAFAVELGIAALVEVHTAEELDIALTCQPALIGVNNRDLRDFTVSLETSFRLRALIPREICMVAESGIHTLEDVNRLAAAGVDAVLVGEALVTAPDVGAQVRSLSRYSNGM